MPFSHPLRPVIGQRKTRLRSRTMAPPKARIRRYSKMRRILELSLKSAARVPVVHAIVEFDITRPRHAMEAYRAAAGESISFTAFIVGCVTAAAVEYPDVQAYRKGGGHIELADAVDVAVMVEREIEGRRHPIVHIVRGADTMSVLDIHAAIRQAQKAPVEEAWDAVRMMKLVPMWAFSLIWPFFWWHLRRSPKLQRKFRGTVAVSALGMFGEGGGWGIPVTNATTVLVGGIGKRLALIDGAVTERETVCLTLSFDHGMVDGAVATRFANRLKELIETGHGLPAAAPAVTPEFAPAG